MIENRVYEAEVVGGGMFRRPATEYERPARGSNSPELCATHAAGVTQGLDLPGLAIKRVAVQDSLRLVHGQNTCAMVSVAKC